MNSTMNPYMKEVLTEMCNRVGANYDEIDFKEQEWYYKYEWTRKEELDFLDWYADYLYTNTKARKSLYRTLPRTKKACKKAADMFIFYTWKLKDGELEKVKEELKQK